MFTKRKSPVRGPGLSLTQFEKIANRNDVESENQEFSQDDHSSVILTHFKTIFPSSAEGVAVISSYGQDPITGAEILIKIHQFDPKQPESAVKFINEIKLDLHRNIYAAPVTYFKLLPNKRGNAGQIVFVYGVVADFDDNAAHNWKERVPVAPSYVLETSPGRYQVFFIFDEPQPPKRVESLAKRLKAYCRCDHGTADLNHVWRIPGLLNWPNQKKAKDGRPIKPVAVKIAQKFSHYIKVGDLESALPEIEEQPKPKTEKHPQDDRAFVWDGILDHLPLKKETIDLIRNGAADRSVALITVLNGLVYAGLDDHQIENILRESPLWLKVEEKGNSADTWLARDIAKARGYIGNNRAENNNQLTMEEIKERVFARAAEPIEGMPKDNAEQSRFTLKYVVAQAFNRQMGCADLFVMLFKGKYIFDHAAGCWYVWACHYWRLEDIAQPLQDCDALIEIFLPALAELEKEKAVLESKAVSANDAEKKLIEAEIKKINSDRKAIYEQITSLKTLSYRKQVIEFSAVGADRLGTSGDKWDSNPGLLPCSNGVVDLKTGILRPGLQSDMLKTSCPTAFNPQAICPRWEITLLEIFNNDLELICFIQRLFGMSLIGEVVEHVLPIFFGSGRNGKDTIIEALRNILGDMAGPVRADMLLDSGARKNPGAPNAEVMALRGKRLVWASETNEGRKLDASTVKELTGGGYLSGREPYGKREVSFKPSHLLCMMTNSKPRANADDYALWKRILLIAFSISFVDNPKEPHERKRDKDLPEKLKSEAEGILAWLVRGCLDYQAEGLNSPDIVMNATKSYQKDEDLLNQFIDDRCVIGPDCWVISSLLYLEYQTWASENGIRSMSGVAFGRKIGKLYQIVVARIDGKSTKRVIGIGVMA